MKGITWSRDSHGLFDYESRHLTKKTMKTQNAVKLIRKGNDLDLQNYDKMQIQKQAEDEEKPLLNIINDNGKSLFCNILTNFLTFLSCLDTFYLESHTKPQVKVESKDLNEHMYLVVRSLKHNNTKIVIQLILFNT